MKTTIWVILGIIAALALAAFIIWKVCKKHKENDKSLNGTEISDDEHIADTEVKKEIDTDDNPEEPEADIAENRIIEPTTSVDFNVTEDITIDPEQSRTTDEYILWQGEQLKENTENKLQEE